MFRIPLKCHGGGEMRVYGPWPAQRLLLVLNRDDVTKDRNMVDRVVAYFCARNFTVIRCENELTLVRLQVFSHTNWPRWLRRGLTALLLASRPRRWRHFSHKYRAHMETVESRLQSLREVMSLLGASGEVSIWSRSAGGRAASLLADELNIHRLICLGYPFQRPGSPAEAARYLHLSDLRTPFLILQGTRDPYGGAEVTEKYPLSSSVKVEFVDTDHDFQLSEEQWEEQLALMHRFICGPNPTRENHQSPKRPSTRAGGSPDGVDTHLQPTSLK